MSVKRTEFEHKMIPIAKRKCGKIYELGGPDFNQYKKSISLTISLLAIVIGLFNIYLNWDVTYLKPKQDFAIAIKDDFWKHRLYFQNVNIPESSTIKHFQLDITKQTFSTIAAVYRVETKDGLTYSYEIKGFGKFGFPFLFGWNIEKAKLLE